MKNPSDQLPAVPTTDAPPASDAAGVRAELDRALAEVDRLTQEVRGHTSTKSTAERQAADLASLRKFHEKALSQVERLTMEKGVLAAEKGSLVKQLAEATAARRGAEQSRSDADKAVKEAKVLMEEKAALEKMLADLQAPRPGLVPPPLPTAGGLNAPPRALEAPPAPAGGGLLNVPEALLDSVMAGISAPPVPVSGPDSGEPSPGVPAHPLAETKDIPIIPIPMQAADSGKINKIRYLCAGCGRKLGAPPEFAGTFGTCKFCGHRGAVPTSSTR